MEEAADNFAREEPRTLGAMFAAERERQGLSRADVAHRLHMSPSQVEALEAGDYERLPKGTFLRGFVRNYAKVLGLDAEPLLEALAGAAPPAPAPRIIVPTQNIRFDPLGERFSSPYVKAATLAVVAVAIGFAAMYWAMYVRPRPPAVTMHKAPASQPAPEAAIPGAPPAELASASAATPANAEPAAPQPVAPASAAPATTKPAAPKSAAPSAASAPAAAATPTPAVAKAPPPPGAKRIRFHFVGDSWVEVRDAAGKVLFQRLNPAGSDAQVTALPPLQVVVGNAPEVQVTWDGKPFDLAPHTEVAVARFTLE